MTMFQRPLALIASVAITFMLLLNTALITAQPALSVVAANTILA